jgi:hypothetical protein
MTDAAKKTFEAILQMPLPPLHKPSECPHCEYDRRFPGFEMGGWLQQDNNGPVVSCPICNDDGSHPRQ